MIYDKPEPSSLKIALISIGIFCVIVALVVGFWLVRVAVSDPKGRGDAVIAKNSALNRIAAQERFEELIQEIKITDSKLDQAAFYTKQNPTDQTSRTIYSGLVSHCLDTIGQYNANARKYTQQAFKDAVLPAQIDMTDATTDCKESAKQ